MKLSRRLWTALNALRIWMINERFSAKAINRISALCARLKMEDSNESNRPQ